MNRPFTGRHMALVLVGFFGTIIAVNVVMARYAASTFGGIVVENSYVASQHFNKWLDDAEAERALGWDAVTAWRPDGRLLVTLKGPGAEASVAGVARHPLGRLPDRALRFEAIGEGRYLSHEAVPEGRWTLRLAVADGAQRWRREEALQ
ncbi:FixH family protein [Sphingopyxis granuli]|uniref:FixH family protein n=1 Tax=Sphingopyxis granuli TaxID=267128 RepID=UPI00082A6093|nr:FixH family protein [Sphingopyxis granuli]